MAPGIQACQAALWRFSRQSKPPMTSRLRCPPRAVDSDSSPYHHQNNDHPPFRSPNISQLMSQYISSFLIEPVVRQARRFSRPANDSSPPDRPAFENNDEGSHRDELATAATAAHEEPSRVSDGTEEFPRIPISGAAEVSSPTSLEGSDRGELQAWHVGGTSTTPLRVVEAENLEPVVNARQYVSRATVPPSNNSPPDGGPSEGVRSATSSFSNSARSMIDTIMSSADTPTQSSRSNSLDTRSRGESQGSQGGDATLPADDGMGPMRKRILAIHRTNSSNEEKARLVHGVMTEKHNSSQPNIHAHHLATAQSPPGSVDGSQRPLSLSSPKSMESLRQTGSPSKSSSLNGDKANPFNLMPNDLKPTYYERPAPTPKNGDQEAFSMDTEEATKSLGCAHYKRNIKLQCSACYRWYTCRFCHDAVEDHMLNRRETKNMLCMLCGCAQPAGEECALCSERGAWYYCDVCKLWDDDPQKSIYHCNDCGICRVGQGLGKDFFHCKVSYV